MFKRFFEAIGLGSSDKIFSEDLDLLVKGYAVAIFADGKVENIEVFVADKLFYAYIEKFYPELDQSAKKNLKLVCHSKLIDLLITFKDDSNEFENNKNSFYLSISKEKNQHVLTDIKTIIDSDNVFADEEQEFFNRLLAKTTKEINK